VDRRRWMLNLSWPMVYRPRSVSDKLGIIPSL
jgi:hypothetical protein